MALDDNARIRILYIEFDMATDSADGEALVAVLNGTPAEAWAERLLREASTNDNVARVIGAVQVSGKSIFFTATGYRSTSAIAQLNALVESLIDPTVGAAPASEPITVLSGTGRSLKRRPRRRAVHAVST